MKNLGSSFARLCETFASFAVLLFRLSVQRTKEGVNRKERKGFAKTRKELRDQA
jgi:hypothetical protein